MGTDGSHGCQIGVTHPITVVGVVHLVRVWAWHIAPVNICSCTKLDVEQGSKVNSWWACAPVYTPTCSYLIPLPTRYPDPEPIARGIKVTRTQS